MDKTVLLAADRVVSLSLRLIGAFNVLFLIAFYLALLFAVTQANAQAAAVCTGQDMLAQMERDDPALLVQIRAEAAAIENGNALLWRIERAGVAPSFLFGTMHVSDPRVVRLTGAAQAAFDAADTVVIETTDVLDQSTMMAALAAKPELMMFSDDTTLFSLLADEDRAAVEAALSARGIPPASVARMKPWMIASMVSLPPCELARKAGGAPVLDVQLAQAAKAAGKDIAGLESAIEQLEAMASLPMEFHMRGLVETLRLGDRIDDVLETMIRLYLNGETSAFWPFFRAALPDQAGDEGGFAAFEERMIIARNRVMAEHAMPFIDRGAAFIAVGAMHLPGEDGVIALLREAGYKVEPEAAEPLPLVGGDVDEHGCKPSAGYSWCEKTKRCERPWELAQSEGFDNTREAYDAFCGNE